MVLWGFTHKCTHIHLLMYMEIYKYSYLCVYDKNSSLTAPKTAIKVSMTVGSTHIKSLIVTSLLYEQCLCTFHPAAIPCAISARVLPAVLHFSYLILLEYSFWGSHSTRIWPLSPSHHWGQQMTVQGQTALLMLDVRHKI